MRRVFDGIRFVFFSRGPVKGLKRLWAVFNRFGISGRRQFERLKFFVLILREEGVRANFFVPAVILKRYEKDFRKLGQDMVEWGVHGYSHTDNSKLSRAEFEAHVSKAVGVFKSCGVAFKGFRAPYLRPHPDTMAVLAAAGSFDYDSSKTVLWERFYGKDRPSYGWCMDFYKPSLVGGDGPRAKPERALNEIPVSLPDDDMLIDRDAIGADSARDIWISVLRECHRLDAVFVLQLHPERIRELAGALRAVIDECRRLNPPVLVTTLGAAAGNPTDASHRGRFCITGDIDSITVFDFVRRLFEW